MFGKIERVFVSACVLFLVFVSFSEAGEGEFSANIPGTEVIFLSGRTDVVIPDKGVYDPAFPILRHGFVASDFLKETSPKTIAAKSGMIFKFSGATGYVHYFNGLGNGSGFGPDGNTSGTSSLYALGGISGYQGPQGPLAGVFLNDANPASTSAPETLDFLSTGLGTQFDTLSPKLGQVFYIGDGYASAGVQQTFIAPAGATRLFLAIPDGWGFWYGPGYYEDNDGSFSIQATYTLPNCAQSGVIGQPCFYDDFNDNSVSTSLWTAGTGGSGPALSETGRRLEITIPASSNNNGTTGFSAGLNSTCKLKGDFDIQLDYNFPAWPSANGVRVALSSVTGPVERVSFGSNQDFYGWPREVYLTHFSDGVNGIVSTTDLSGKLRLTRTGATATGYYYANGAWVPVHTAPSSTDDTAFSISAWSHDYAFTDQEERVALDNLIINKGELLCGNEAPVANAGPDQTIDCAGPSGAAVTLDGSDSSDANNDMLTYTWSWNGWSAAAVKPTVTLPNGASTVTLTVDDQKGKTATDTVVITVRDTVAPATNLRSIVGIPGDNGWYKSAVTMALEATDACSGVKEIHYSIDGAPATAPGNTATFTVMGDKNHTITYGAADNAMNAEQAHTTSVKIDSTNPVITATISPLANSNGWHNTDVTVTFACSDATSGVASCPAPILVTTEGAGQTITGTATDEAGNSASTAVILNIDKTAPTAELSLNPGILWPPNHKMVNVLVTGGPADATSGVVSVDFTVVDEYGTVQPLATGFNTTIALEAWREGTDMDGRHYGVTATITDKAGNRTVVTTGAICPHDMRDKQ